MDIRTATSRDTDRIRRIAEQSFQTSYSLSPDQIETVVEGVFSDGRLDERIADSSSHQLVAVADDDPVGFADIEFGEPALLHWLHVEPGNRGQGVGTALFERAATVAEDQGQPLVGRVLAEGDEGERFCEQFGYERGEKTKLEFDDETFFAYVYANPDEIRASRERSVDVPETVTTDGKTLSVDEDDETPGTDGLFFRTYEEGSEDSYGYYCTNCGATDVGSDTLGRLECQNCGNKHLADSWDAAYL